MKFGTIGVYGNPELVIDQLIKCLHESHNEEVWEMVYPLLQQARENFVKMKWKSLGEDVVESSSHPTLISPGSLLISQQEETKQRSEWIGGIHIHEVKEPGKSYMITDGEYVSIGKFYDDLWYDSVNVLKKFPDRDDVRVTHFRELPFTPFLTSLERGENKDNDD